jgi:hypothetical protein
MSSEFQLPVPVLAGPHWRVNIRPERYEAGAIVSLGECFSVVERAAVRLRGWPYPAVSRNSEERDQGTNWVASWCSFRGHSEYWRFYQSKQFLHLFAVREATESAWAEKLRITAMGHLGHMTSAGPKSLGVYQ